MQMQSYIIKKRCSEPHNNMDIEHIIPQSRLDGLSTRERGVVGISSPSNLTFLPMFDNRAKREKTYYELKDRANTLINLFMDIYYKKK